MLDSSERAGRAWRRMCPRGNGRARRPPTASRALTAPTRRAAPRAKSADSGSAGDNY